MGKVQTGIAFFDAHYRGVYGGRCWLLSGPSGSGKSAIGLQFLLKGLQQGERCLLLTIHRAVDTVLWVCSHGVGMERALESGQLTVLEYADFLPGRDTEHPPSLPTEGFLDLQHIVNENGIQRIVLDTVLPWATTRNPDKMPERVFSLIRAFERLQCATLLVVPRPVSPLALQLKQTLETIVSVAVDLSLSLDTGERVWTTVKYLGHETPLPPVSYVLLPGHGISAAVPGQAPPVAAHAPEPARAARFAAGVFGAASHGDRAPDRSGRAGIPGAR